MFNDLVSLMKHIKHIHNNNRNRNISQCLICGHHSDNMSDLKNHRITHKIDNYMDIFHSELNINIKDSEYNLQLMECFMNPDGTITNNGQLRYKKWQDFNFTCKLCPLPEKTFNFMEYYLHCSTEHSDNKEPKYICSDCPQHCVATFSHMPTLVTHQISCHNKDLSYWYVCGYIQKE